MVEEKAGKGGRGMKELGKRGRRSCVKVHGESRGHRRQRKKSRVDKTKQL